MPYAPSPSPMGEPKGMIMTGEEKMTQGTLTHIKNSRCWGKFGTTVYTIPQVGPGVYPRGKTIFGAQGAVSGGERKKLAKKSKRERE